MSISPCPQCCHLILIPVWAVLRAHPSAPGSFLGHLLPHSLIPQMWTSAGGLARAAPASTAATTFPAVSAALAALDTDSVWTRCPVKVSVSFSWLGEQSGIFPSPCLPQVMSLPS